MAQRDGGAADMPAEASTERNYTTVLAWMLAAATLALATFELREHVKRTAPPPTAIEVDDRPRVIVGVPRPGDAALAV
jgi:hypothetical protein